MNVNDHRWVVLGAGGFIGTNLCSRLIDEGAEVVAFGRNANFPNALKGCQWQEGSFLDQTALAKAIKGAGIVVHALSTVNPAKSNESPIADVEENLVGTLRLIELCRNHGVKRLIILSSGGTVYGLTDFIPTPEDAPTNPICSYGIVKLAIEKYLALYQRQTGLDAIVLRVANPFGPYQIPKDQGVIAAAMQRIVMGQSPEIWGDGTVVRDYIYIDDVIDAILAAAKLSDINAPRLYNIGSGVGRSLNEVMDSIAKIHGKITVTRRSGRSVDVPVSVLDIHRAQHFLQWQPRCCWHESLLSTYLWFQNVYKSNKEV